MVSDERMRSITEEQSCRKMDDQILSFKQSDWAGNTPLNMEQRRVNRDAIEPVTDSL